VIRYIDNHELAYAMNKLQPDYVCLLGYHQLDEHRLLSQVNQLMETKIQVILLGAVAEYVQSSVSDEAKVKILLVNHFQDLLQILMQGQEVMPNAQ
jgi:hypothetical protein